MNLVVLTNIPTPYRTAFFDALAAEAARTGNRFHVLYCAKTEPGRHWPYEPARMKHAHTVLRGFHPSFAGLHAHLNPGVLAELNRLKSDTLLIAGAWNTPTMLIAGLDITAPSPRRFFWSEGHAGAVLNKGGLIAWLRRRIYRTFDGFAVPNQASAEWALAQAGGPRPTLSLPNAIDAEFFARPAGVSKSASRQKLGLEGVGRLLVQVSALTDRKGVLELADRFLGIPLEDRRGARLLFVGEGPRRPELEALAAKSGGSIRLLGQLPPEEVSQVLWAADAFVLYTKLDLTIAALIGHDGFGYPSVGSHDHWLHHAMVDCNFGENYVPLDWIFGTYAGSEEEFTGKFGKPVFSDTHPDGASAEPLNQRLPRRCCAGTGAM